MITQARKAKTGAKVAAGAGKRVFHAGTVWGRARSLPAIARRSGPIVGTRTEKRTAVAPVVAAGAAGVAGAYLFDPENGKRRRHILKDKTASVVRRGSAEARRKADHVAGKAVGVAAEATPSPRNASKLNDEALTRKAESEIFQATDVPKGKVNLNVEDGVLYLRGELERDQIKKLATAARSVAGVDQVANLLHVPGEPAPSKESAAA
jgi:hypothetical protein